MTIHSRFLSALVVALAVAACDPGGSYTSAEVANSATNRQASGTDETGGGATSTEGSQAPRTTGSEGDSAINTLGATNMATSGSAGTATTTIQAFDPTAPVVPAVTIHRQLHVEGTELRDEQGNAVQLKGPSGMWLNWEKTGFAKNPQGMQFLRDNWRASLVRAAMGVDASGAYLEDAEFAKAQVRAIVDLTIELGIYVIIEMRTVARPEAFASTKPRGGTTG